MFLYQRKGMWRSAFDAGLEANYLLLFDDIERSTDFDYTLLRFRELYEGYGSIFTKFLYSHTNNISPHSVLKEFDRCPELDRHICEYLHQLCVCHVRFDEPYHTKLALLYIKFHDPCTLDYVKQPDTKIDYKRVLDAAMNAKMYHEAAFISHKMGDIVGGMQIYLEFIKNPRESVEYAIGAHDTEAMEQMIEKAYTDVDLLAVIIENMPSLEIDYMQFMRKIPRSLAFEERPQLVEASNRAIEEFGRHLRTVELVHEEIGKSAFSRHHAQILARNRAVIKICADD